MKIKIDKEKTTNAFKLLGDIGTPMNYKKANEEFSKSCGKGDKLAEAAKHFYGLVTEKNIQISLGILKQILKGNKEEKLKRKMKLKKNTSHMLSL